MRLFHDNWCGNYLWSLLYYRSLLFQAANHRIRLVRLTGLARETGHARRSEPSFGWLNGLRLTSGVIVGSRRGCAFRLDFPKGQFYLIPAFFLDLLEDGKQLQLCNDLIRFVLYPFLKHIVLVILLDDFIVSEQLLQLGQQASVLCRHFWAFVHV